MASFLGREESLRTLEQRLPPRGSTKIICLTGDAGIGKTSLAYHLCERVKARFQEHGIVSAYRRDWDTVVRRIAHIVLGPLPAKATRDELEQRVVGSAASRSHLLFIDNVDNVEPTNIQAHLARFMSAWGGVSSSVLVLTTERLSIDAPAHCHEEKVVGLAKKDDITELLGPTLTALIDRHSLYDDLDLLSGNPQKLLALRWIDPQDAKATRGSISGLIVDDNQQLQDQALEHVLSRIKLPIKHFLAIAKVRGPTFDEGLLAFLWDRLGGGSTELYTQVLRRLMDHGLLSATEPGRLRLNASVHAQLEKPFQHLISDEHQAHIQYFIGEYYRNCFAAGTDPTEGDPDRPAGRDLIPIEELENYVHHTVAAGQVESVFAYLIDQDIVDRVHAAGLSLDLLSLLKLMDEVLYWKMHPPQSRWPNGNLAQERRDGLEDLGHRLGRWLEPGDQAALPADLHYPLSRLAYSIPYHVTATTSSSDAQGRLKLMRAYIKAELGRTHKDLNQHEAALDYLGQADELVESIPKDETRARQKRRLQADIAHYRGILYSITGENEKCLETYWGGLKRLEGDEFTARDALTMGYLAYELKFRDMELALEVAKGAVKAAERFIDNSVLAKNWCSLGQIQSFCQQKEASDGSFDQAKTICEHIHNPREWCRILVNRSVNDIAARRFDDALRHLQEVKRDFEQTGDRRRVWMAIAYRGIVAYHQGTREHALHYQLRAMGLHDGIGAHREAIYEAMTYVWMTQAGAMSAPEADLQEQLEATAGLELPAVDKDNLAPELFDGSPEAETVDDALKPELVKQILDPEMPESSRIYAEFWRRHYLPTLLAIRKA